MAKLDRLGKVIETDVLVIGGGSSGLWSAKRARELGKDVLIIDKGPRDWGGLASMSGGDLDVVMPDENVEDWVQDLVYYYDGLCEQDFMEKLFRESYDRLQDYLRFGCQFRKTPDGKLQGIPQRGLDHIKLYFAMYKGKGGEDMMRGLTRDAFKAGIRRMSRTMVTDLLTRDGRVVGAVGFNTYNGQFYIFKAKAVLLTGGASGFKASYLQNTSTGEGIHMAYRAGVELRNFEFVKVWNVPKEFAWESQTTLLPLGARFVNAVGEDFMMRYCPTFGAKADPHFNVIGMCIEVREGRGPLYFDISAMKEADIKMVEPQLGWQLMNYRKMKEVGIEFFKQKTEWMPQLMGSFGGMLADLDGRTKLEGLFIAGRGRSVDPGVYIGGFALSTTATSGHITGKVAGEYASSHDYPEIDGAQVERFRNRLHFRLGRPGVAPKQVLTAIQEVVFPYDVSIMKNERSLQAALKKIEYLKNEIEPQMTAKDPHYLMKLIEVQAILFTAEAYL